MTETLETSTECFTPAGRAVLECIPAVTILIHARKNKTLARDHQIKLLLGEYTSLNDIDEQIRYDGACWAVAAVCERLDIPMNSLSLRELNVLVGVARERDEAPRIVEQLAANTGVVTVGFPVPGSDADQLLLFLGLPDGDNPIRDDLSLRSPSASENLPHVLCHMKVSDLLRIAAAPSNHLVTLTVGVLSLRDVYAFEPSKEAALSPTLTISVDELRCQAWLSGPARAYRVGDHKYAGPSFADVEKVELFAPPDGPERETYERLRADGRTTRSALDAAKSLRLLDEPPGCDPRRTITVPREVSRRDGKATSRVADKQPY